MMNKKSLLLLLLLISFFYTCKDDNKSEMPDTIFVTKSEVLSSLASNLILPSYEEFEAKATIVKQSAISYNSISTESNLEQLQSDWKTMMKAWKACEVFNIGKVKESFIHNIIESWPANATFIERNIQGTDSITDNYLNRKGSSSKGVSGIEYLIFGNNNNAVVIDSFNISTNRKRRKQYLQAACNILEADAIRATQIWKNYQSSFSTDDGSAIKSSFNLFGNELLALTERMLTTKVGKPIGKSSGLSPDFTLLESYRSGHSLENLTYNLQSIENIFFLPDDNNALELSSYVNSIRKDQNLSNRIDSQIKNCYQAINNLNSPLRISITNDLQKVEILHNELFNLFVIFNAELTSSLSLINIPNDNDGD